MRHINTTSDAESAMRDLYKTATDASPITASKNHEEAIERIIGLSRKIDMLKLNMSNEIGALMGYMQGHTQLVSPTGRILATWKQGNSRKSVDYEAIFAECNVPDYVIKAHTTMTEAARTFTVVD